MRKMSQMKEKKPVDPLKKILYSYRATLAMRDECEAEIADSFERATSCTVRMKPYKASGGKASYDRMADDVLESVDGRARLEREIEKLNQELNKILDLIALADTRDQRQILIMRYVRGKPWKEIADWCQSEWGRAEGWAYVQHGLALKTIREKAGFPPPNASKS